MILSLALSYQGGAVTLACRRSQIPPVKGFQVAGLRQGAASASGSGELLVKVDNTRLIEPVT